MIPNDEDIKEFSGQARWERWLDREHERADQVWIKFAKKRSGKRSVTYAEAVESALCYGWIDGLARGLDEDHYLQRFTPRRPRSQWSRINREKATALIEAGRMKPAGAREVERAKADGRWDAAYDPPSTIRVPQHLSARLAQEPAAKAFFEGLSKSYRYSILYNIENAKRPETRVRRIEKFVEMLKRGEKP